MSGIGPGVAVAADLNGHAAVPIHLPYPIAYPVALTEVGGQLLEPAAAQAFRTMVRAARQEDVHIVLRSGYRSHSRQSWLFYGVAAARGITLAERARVSAPPGYSEHHTGYALDLDDGRDPQYLRQSFERTRAGRWLVANAHRFCFEMSFPRDNPQGIAYEPWHWRFVGSEHAQQTFAEAHAHFPGDVAGTGFADRAGALDGGCPGLPGQTAQAGGDRCGTAPACPARPDRVADASQLAESAQR